MFTELKEVGWKYCLYRVTCATNGGEKALLTEGVGTLPASDPGETGKARMEVPAGFFDADVLELEAYDANGKSICNWTWPIKYAADYYETQRAQAAVAQGAVANVAGENVTLNANGVSVTFTKSDGILQEVKQGDKVIPLSNGPVTVGMKTKFKEAYTRQDGKDALFVVKYLGGVDSIVWRMTPDGM